MYLQGSDADQLVSENAYTLPLLVGFFMYIIVII